MNGWLNGIDAFMIKMLNAVCSSGRRIYKPRVLQLKAIVISCDNKLVNSNNITTNNNDTHKE